MALQYSRHMLRVSLAQMCLSLGWNSIHSTPLELLTDVLERYMMQLGNLTHRYAEQFGRTEPCLDDLSLAFDELGVSVPELADYLRHVDPNPFPKNDLPKYPVEKPSLLQFPAEGSRELAERGDSVDSHLPPMNPSWNEEMLTPKSSSSTAGGATFLSPGETPHTGVSPSSGGAEKRIFTSPTDICPPTKKQRLIPDEAGPSQYNMIGIRMSQSGFLTPTKQGRLPEARTPPPPTPSTDLRPVTPTGPPLFPGASQIQVKTPAAPEAEGKLSPKADQLPSDVYSFGAQDELSDDLESDFNQVKPEEKKPQLTGDGIKTPKTPKSKPVKITGLVKTSKSAKSPSLHKSPSLPKTPKTKSPAFIKSPKEKGMASKMKASFKSGQFDMKPSVKKSKSKSSSTPTLSKEEKSIITQCSDINDQVDNANKTEGSEHPQATIESYDDAIDSVIYNARKEEEEKARQAEIAEQLAKQREKEKELALQREQEREKELEQEKERKRILEIERKNAEDLERQRAFELKQKQEQLLLMQRERERLEREEKERQLKEQEEAERLRASEIQKEKEREQKRLEEEKKLEEKRQQEMLEKQQEEIMRQIAEAEIEKRKRSSESFSTGSDSPKKMSDKRQRKDKSKKDKSKSKSLKIKVTQQEAVSIADSSPRDKTQQKSSAMSSPEWPKVVIAKLTPEDTQRFEYPVLDSPLTAKEESHEKPAIKPIRIGLSAGKDFTIKPPRSEEKESKKERKKKKNKDKDREKDHKDRKKEKKREKKEKERREKQQLSEEITKPVPKLTLKIGGRVTLSSASPTRVSPSKTERDDPIKRPLFVETNITSQPGMSPMSSSSSPERVDLPFAALNRTPTRDLSLSPGPSPMLTPALRTDPYHSPTPPPKHSPSHSLYDSHIDAATFSRSPSRSPHPGSFRPSPSISPQPNILSPSISPVPTITPAARAGKGPPVGQQRGVIIETVGKIVDEHGETTWICPSCKMPDDGSPMIGCDACDDWYHWPCVGIDCEPPENENWYCPRCNANISSGGSMKSGRGRAGGRGRGKKRGGGAGRGAKRGRKKMV